MTDLLCQQGAANYSCLADEEVSPEECSCLETNAKLRRQQCKKGAISNVRCLPRNITPKTVSESIVLRPQYKDITA